MIIVRSPLRISLGGGGTDLPSYYEAHGGFLMAAAINKYVYITLHHTFEKEIIVKYSKLERAQVVADIEHPIVRVALLHMQLPTPHIEITSMADIPAGTGLGSSGSFTTALLKGLYTYTNQSIQTQQLAELACHLELNLLQEPIGKQDQYISAYGGIQCVDFHPDHRVTVAPLSLQPETLAKLENNLLLFFTGYSRSASSILKDQHEKSLKHETRMLDNLHMIKELGLKSKAALLQGDLHEFAHLMNVHWEWKRKRSDNMSNAHIDNWYHQALAHGAVGGKMIGAGGGGFLMFYSENHALLRELMQKNGLSEVPFKFDYVGTQVVTQS